MESAWLITLLARNPASHTRNQKTTLENTSQIRNIYTTHCYTLSKHPLNKTRRIQPNIEYKNAAIWQRFIL